MSFPNFFCSFLHNKRKTGYTFLSLKKPSGADIEMLHQKACSFLFTI